MATELAKAYVQIIPSAQGIQGQISNVMNGESADAGESSGKSFASSFGSVAKKALAGIGIAKIVSDGINSTSEFETAMAKTSTLFTGSAEEFDALKAQILDLSGSYGVAATTLAEAAYSAESASVPMEQLGPMLESSAKLATAGFTDIDTALSATAKTMNAYGEAAMSADDIQKVLIQTQNLGITTVGELGASLANVTPTAAAMGVGFDQVGAAMAQLTASGVQTAQATTQLRSAMTELGKSGTKADKAFREAAKGTKYANMGFKEAMAAGANLGDVFGMMQSYADKTGVSMVDLWGSVEAGNAAMIIASDVKKFNSNLEQMSTESDVVGEAYGKMANTFGNSMNRLKESAKNFMTTLFTGGDISTAFDNMLGSLGDVGERLTEWLTTGLRNLGESLPDMMESVLKFGDGLLDALGNVDWIGLGVSILNGIVGALGTLGSHLIELVGSAIKSVTTGGVNFGEIGTAIWNGVTSVITTAGDWLKTLFDSAVSAVGGINFGEIGTAIWDGVTSIITTTGDWLKELFGFGRDAAEGEDYSSIGTKILDGVKSILDSAGEFLGNIFNSGLSAASEQDWPSLGDAIKTGVNLILNGGAFLSEIFTAGAELVKAINWTEVGQHAETLIVNGLDGAATLVSTISTAADTLLTSIGWESIGQGITGLINAGLGGATQLVTTISGAADTILTSIGWEAIGKGITDLLNAGLNGATVIVTTVSEAAGNLISGIQWETIGQDISGLLETGLKGAAQILEGGFTAAHGVIKGIQWSEIGEAIGKGVSGTIDAAGEFLKAPFEAAKALIMGIPWGEVGSTISSGLGDVWTGLTGFVGGLFGGAGDIVQGFGSGVGATFEGLGEAIGNLFSGNDAKQAAEDLKKSMSDFEKAMKDGEETIKTTAKSIGTTIRTSIEGELTTAQMNAIGSAAIADIGTGAGQAESGLTTKMGNIGKDAAATFTSSSDWKSVGQNIISGIISGVNSYAYMLVMRMQEIGTMALNAIKSALEISSPSRVMRDSVGRWIPAGIAMGITDNVDLVEDAMNELATDVAATNINGTLAAQGRGFGSYVGGDAAAGNDEGIFARIVSAVREGMNNVEIALYLDGQKVSERVNEYLGDEMAVRRLV